MYRMHTVCFVFICVFISIFPGLANAFDEHPRKDEGDTIRKMCDAPWDNVDYFKKRFPEAVEEAKQCKNYMCINENTPALDYTVDRRPGSFGDISLYKSIIISARPGGLEERMRKLDHEGIKALKSGDKKKAQEVINEQKRIRKKNGF